MGGPGEACATVVNSRDLELNSRRGAADERRLAEQAKAKIEAELKVEYQRLLNELTEQFEITLAGVAKPFLGQSMPLKAAVTLACEPGKTFPFPQNVKRFRWSTDNCSGSTSSGPQETALPYWFALFYKADPACVKVWALDDAGNYLAANKVFIAEPQPLTLSGTIKISKSDYPGKPPLTVVQNRSALGVTTMTTVLESASQPGAFQFRVVEFNFGGSNLSGHLATSSKSTSARGKAP